MTFLNPVFLWGLAAVAIPIAIHLFNFRRTRRVYFSNVAFLEQVNVQTSRFRRLRQWLILAARLLAVSCLALAFAQPFIPARNAAGLRQMQVTGLYIDNSFSMQNLLDNRLLLDDAVMQAEALTRAFEQSPTLQLLTNDFSAASFGLESASQLRNRLAGVGLSPGSQTLPEVYRRQRQLAGSHQSSGGQFFWFSDFQKSTAGSLAAFRPAPSDRLFLVPIQAPPTGNVSVDSVWLQTPFVREMQPNLLHVRLRNTGRKAVENLPVRLLIDGLQVSVQTTTVPAAAQTDLRFTFTVQGRGYRRGEISFDDSPLVFDNAYFFVLNAAPRIRVLHLYDSRLGSYIENVFSNDSLFQRRSVPLTQANPGQLAAADLVVAEGPRTLEGRMQADLDAFVRQGGSVLFIPPADPGPGPLLPAFGTVQALPAADTPPVLLADPDRRNPFFQDAFETGTPPTDRLSLPAAQPRWRWPATGRTLLALRSGQPFLSVAAYGRGQVYVLAAPLSPAFGDFARHALFVPVMYAMAARSVRQEPLAYTFSSQTLSLSLPQAQANDLFHLRLDSLDVLPVQRLNGTQLSLEMPRADQLAGGTLRAGIYALQRRGQTLRLLAFNHNSRESGLDVYSPEELKQLFAAQKNISIYDGLDGAGLVRTFQEENVGRPLWKWFIAAALLWLLVEIGLIRLMKD